MPIGRESVQQNFRIVVMGTVGVGKSSIISKFMHGKFCESHKETIEELHRHRMQFESVSVDIDILDTSGSHQFPAMRKLAIATGDAFLLVFSVIDPESFETVKDLRAEIREQKHNGQYSIVVVANKTDIDKADSHSHAVTGSVVCMDWEEKYVATSAKTGTNIDIVFQSLENKIREKIKPEEKRPTFIRRISLPVMRKSKSEKAGLLKRIFRTQSSKK
ncbi:ras-related protein Rap-2a-like [Mya arenaria]|uniref:ras-related protein Rap-2a-like n=1 Tax=Mya arenaria TaxID=6604 RepID=UPI0022E7335F|nr:ras-related protein Rap-2a-like [Mya arenaria]XP_052777674.1 ras-related protein Rap-2a-like [Mya arenaria]